MTPPREDRGATVLEFALVSLLVLTVLLGVLQYGYQYWAVQTAAATARESARHLAVGADPRSTGCAAAEARSHAAGPALGSVSVTSSTTNPTMGSVISVTVSFTSLDLHLPILPVPNGGQVSQTAQARVESVHAGTVADPYTGC